MGQTNLFDAVIDGEQRVRWNGGALSVASTRGFEHGQKVTILVPPDFIALAEPAATENVVTGTLTDVQRQGDISTLTLLVADAPLRFRLTTREVAAHPMHVGDALRVQLDASTLHVMRES